MSKRRFSKKKDYKISKESADEQVVLMLEYLAIDIDIIEDEATKNDIEQELVPISEYIRLGRLEIKSENEKLQIVQTRINPENDAIVYKNFGGTIKAAMANKKKDDEYGRMYALLGASCELGESTIKNLDPRDLRVSELLAILFL